MRILLSLITCCLLFLCVKINAQKNDLFSIDLKLLTKDSFNIRKDKDLFYKTNILKKIIKQNPAVVSNIFIENLKIIKNNTTSKMYQRKITRLQMSINKYIPEEQYNLNIYSTIYDAKNIEITKKIANFVINRKPYDQYYYYLVPIVIQSASNRSKEKILTEFNEMRNSSKNKETLRRLWVLGKALSTINNPEALQYIINLLSDSQKQSPSLLIELGKLHVREITNHMIESVILKNISQDPIADDESKIAAVVSVMYNTIKEFHEDLSSSKFREEFSTEAISRWYQKNKNTYHFIKKTE